jgi:hypothetical protein
MGIGREEKIRQNTKRYKEKLKIYQIVLHGEDPEKK